MSSSFTNLSTSSDVKYGPFAVAVVLLESSSVEAVAVVSTASVRVTPMLLPLRVLLPGVTLRPLNLGDSQTDCSGSFFRGKSVLLGEVI